MTKIRLRNADDLLLRPTAEGSLVIVGAGRPMLLAGVHERAVAICTRPTDRVELVGVLAGLGESDESVAVAAIDDLVERGVLQAV